MTEARSREARLKAALRDNLRRRKAQARGRAASALLPDDPMRGPARSEEDAAREARMTEVASALEAKRAEIAALIALDLGYGDLAELAPAERAAVEEATDAAIERRNAVVADESDPIAANVRLSRLLAEYRDLEQLRIDEAEVRLIGEGGGREDDA